MVGSSGVDSGRCQCPPFREGARIARVGDWSISANVLIESMATILAPIAEYGWGRCHLGMVRLTPMFKGKTDSAGSHDQIRSSLWSS